MIIKELIVKFSGNILIVFLASIFSIVSLPLSINLYFKSKKEKLLEYKMKNNVIFQDFESIIESVKVTFENKSISTLSVTRILIWCTGKEIIYGTDVATQMPLIISSRNGKEILEAKIIKVSNKTNNLSLEKIEDNSYKISFEYLENNDAFDIQITHTGSTHKDIMFTGKIKGMKGKIERKNSKNNEIITKLLENKWADLIINKCFFYFLTFVSLVVAYMYIFFLISNPKEFLKIEMNIHFIFIGYFLILISSIRSILRKRRVPKEFRDFWDD